MIKTKLLWCLGLKMKQIFWKRVVMIVVVEKWKRRKLYVYKVVLNDHVDEGYKFDTDVVV